MLEVQKAKYGNVSMETEIQKREESRCLVPHDCNVHVEAL